MKKGLKRNTALVMVLILIASIFAGCGSSGGTTSASDTMANATEGSTAKQLESETNSQLPKDISFTIRHNIDTATAQGTVSQDKWLNMMEAYMGTKLNIKWEEIPQLDYVDTQKVYFASGDYADIFIARNDYTLVSDLGASEKIIDLKKYSIPYYSQFLSEDPKGRAKVTESNGSIYGFAQGYCGSNTGTSMNFAINLDVFEKNNLTPPSTMEEVYTVGKTLKKLYPNSYPMNNLWDSLEWCTMMWNHTSKEIFYNGEKYLFGPTQDTKRFKETLVWLHKMYAEGIIDPEYKVETFEQTLEKMLNGSSFMQPYQYASVCTDSVNAASNGKVRWGFISNPKNLYEETAWKVGSQQKGKYLATNAIVISANTKYPEYLVKLVDYQFSDEMITLATYGIEGITFNYNDKNEPTYIDSILKAKSPYAEMAQYGIQASGSCRAGISYMPQHLSTIPWVMPVWDKGEYFEDAADFFTERVSGDESINPSDRREGPVVSFTSQQNEEIKSIKTPLTTYVDEAVAKFVNGDYTIEKDWDSFMSGFAKFDIQKIVDMYNKAADDYYIKVGKE